MATRTPTDRARRSAELLAGPVSRGEKRTSRRTPPAPAVFGGGVGVAGGGVWGVWLTAS